MRNGLLVLPFLFILAGIPFANRPKPFILGLPFSLFWISIGILFAAVTLLILYKIDPKNKEQKDR